MLSEPLDHLGHEGGLAHLARGEDVAELALQEAFEQERVGVSGDVGEGIGGDVAAGDVEGIGLVDTALVHSNTLRRN